MITFVLSLTLITSAFADEYAPAAVDGEQASEELGRLAAQIQILEAELAESRKCPSGCPATPAPAPKAKAPASAPAPQPAPAVTPVPPQQTVVVEPIGVSVDPRVAELEAQLAQAKADYASLTAAVAALGSSTGNAEAPKVEVKVEPVVIRTERTVVETRVSGFHPTVYATGGAVFGPPLEGGTPGYAGQFALGTRPTWDISDHSAFGLVVEGSWGSGGPGVRGIATILRTGQAGEIGIGAGPSYSCDDLEIGEGCFTEHIGGVVRGSAGLQVTNFGGVLLHVDEEVNYLTLDGGIEFRTVIGLGWYFGNAHPDTVTVE